VLLGEECRVGGKHPYSREKLMPVLGFFVEDNWEKACQLCLRILALEGAGHTMCIHSRDSSVIREFGLKKPVSRLIVNAPAALAAIGAATGLAPSLTLGCGAVGRNSTSDNVGPLNLINIRRVAHGLKEIEDIRLAVSASPGAASAVAASPPAGEDLLDELVRRVMARLEDSLVSH
jgi:hypothetical protein